MGCRWKDKAALVGFVLCFLTGCDNYVEKTKYDESQSQLQKARTELGGTKKQLEEAQKQINELAAHKFSTYQNGGRTWRFDSSTGETCLLLASEFDWKNKKTKNQSCNCQDTRADYMKSWVDAKTPEEKKAALDIWGPTVKDACGE